MPLKEDGTRNIDTEWDQAKTWAQMEAVLASGKVKAIGVSNFSPLLLDQLSKTWKTVPAVNQVELHPYCPQHDLKKYCEEKNILLQAYSPLGSTSTLLFLPQPPLFISCSLLLAPCFSPGSRFTSAIASVCSLTPQTHRSTPTPT